MVGACCRGRMCCVFSCLALALAALTLGPQAADARMEIGTAGPATSRSLPVGQSGKIRVAQRIRRVKPVCNYPWSYSRRFGRCVCMRQGHGLVDGRCVVKARSCPGNGKWSAEQGACVCENGFVERQGRCISPDAARSAVTAQTAGAWLELPSVLLVQRCLKEAGYLRGAPRTRMTPNAWTAYWFFKREHKTGSTPDGVRNVKALQKLFKLCPVANADVPRDPVRAVAERRRASLPGTPKGRTVEDAPPVVYARPEIGCLPNDLHRLIVATYGPRPGLDRCKRVCVPIPADLTKKEIADYQSRRGVTWCRACIQLGSNLPLEDILRIERGANVQICTRPPTQLPRWASPNRKARNGYTKVRAIYRALPPNLGHENDIAVIIGNRNYRDGIEQNDNAHNNAGALYALLTENMGYAHERIIDLRDATLDDLRRTFGGAGNHKGALWRRVQARPKSRVLVYFAGHGSTNADRSDSYLLPVDAVKHREDRTAYAMSLLYANLAKLGASSTLVLLETGFGRDHGRYVFAPNLPEFSVKSLPPSPIPQLTVITAVDGDQKPLDDPLFQIGLFTRHVIEGLAGQADVKPVGNGDQRIDAVELYAHVAHMVGLAARKSFGLIQHPLMSLRGNHQVSRVQAQVR